MHFYEKVYVSLTKGQEIYRIFLERAPYQFALHSITSTGSSFAEDVAILMWFEGLLLV